jgi:chromosome segregation ATPase
MARNLYTHEYPSMAEIERMPLADLQAFTNSLQEDVGLVTEETQIFSSHLKAQKDKDLTARADIKDDGGAGREEDESELASAATTATSYVGKRRGKGYRRKSSDNKDILLTLEEKQAVVAAEQDRLKVEREKNERMAEDAKDLIRATLEESQIRINEVKMEMAHFKREIAFEKKVSAEKVLKYFMERPQTKEAHILKLKDKCTSLNTQIAKCQAQLRQREGVGETFHTIDFDQLRIENQQFQQRIADKNVELVDLKGTTTRTVQMLNTLTDKLNELTAEQTQLRKEMRLREEHVDKLKKEIEQAQREGDAATKKHNMLKLQHEAVKVPKVEDYIAQKAEMYELEKASANWARKVEIATGHMNVMKQQMLSCRKKLSGPGTIAASK